MFQWADRTVSWSMRTWILIPSTISRLHFAWPWAWRFHLMQSAVYPLKHAHAPLISLISYSVNTFNLWIRPNELNYRKHSTQPICASRFKKRRLLSDQFQWPDKVCMKTHARAWYIENGTSYRHFQISLQRNLLFHQFLCKISTTGST